MGKLKRPEVQECIDISSLIKKCEKYLDFVETPEYVQDGMGVLAKSLELAATALTLVYGEAALKYTSQKIGFKIKINVPKSKRK